MDAHRFDITGPEGGRVRGNLARYDSWRRFVEWLNAIKARNASR